MRIRTGYSFKTAVGHLDEVADRLVEIGWKVGPISDRLSTFGFTEWTKLCEKRGLRPVYGAELPVTHDVGSKVVDWWAFFALAELRPLHEAVEMATENGALSYQQAESWPGCVKLTGERTQLDRITKKAKDVYVSLSPSTPRGLYNAARKKGLQFIASSDNYYTRDTDREFYKVAIGMRASTQSYPQHVLSDEEHGRLLAWSGGDLKSATRNRDRVLARCAAQLEHATLLHPQANRTLRELCEEGANRLGVDLSGTYAERLDKELALIAEKKFEDYFHIIADLMRWSREHMVVGPARGSSCGSLVCYLLGITSIDPIPYGLIFERFIDTTRTDLPDIDLDFSDDKRHLAFEYLIKKYGADRAVRLGSVNYFQAKSAIKATAIALRIPMWQENEWSNTVIKRSTGDARSDSTVVDTLHNTDVGRRILAEFPNAVIADRLENHPAAQTQHAAGMVVTDQPVIRYVAIDGRTGTTMCDKYDAEALNLLKIDMLGLTQLSVFERTLELIGEQPRNGFLEAIPLDDQTAFDVLNKLKFSGVFQFQHPGSAMQTLTTRLIKVEKGRMDHIEDLAAMTAVVRPGPMGSGAADNWMRRRAGNEKIVYAHPALEPYLRDTLGVVLYQEQVMHIGRDIGGLNWEEVTALRKAMSKSLGMEFFDQYGDKFKMNALKVMPDFGKRSIDQFWADLCQFGQWAFNRSHSVAYGVVSYWSCWLKAHYPVEFAAATLDAEKEPKKQVVMLKEMRDEGVDYVPIDPDRSIDRWTIKGRGKKKVLVGPLQNIIGVGPVAVRDIMDARRNKTDLRPSLQKKLENAQTALTSLSPIRDAVMTLHPDLEKVGIASRPTDISELVGDDEREVLILARITKIAPLDENEIQRVARRKGRKYDGPTAALNTFMEDDTGMIFCKIDRWDMDRATSDMPEGMGRWVVAHANKNRSLFAIKGVVPSDFRMIRVRRIRYLGEYSERGITHAGGLPKVTKRG